MREWLPVNNKRPLCIDIVANISKAKHDPTLTSCAFYIDDDLKRVTSCAFDIYSYEYVLQLSSVLSRLKPRDGSVRVSILDILQTQSLFDRKDAANFDWRVAQELRKNKIGM
jgi:hypothetical protein